MKSDAFVVNVGISYWLDLIMIRIGPDIIIWNVEVLHPFVYHHNSSRTIVGSAGVDDDGMTKFLELRESLNGSSLRWPHLPAFRNSIVVVDGSVKVDCEDHMILLEMAHTRTATAKIA